ncbi:hypothetical protein H0H92_000810 [Tricholoma furcatifolium]|nr:hypothetical protein H0H92_000810 [Tricholoma furcatifolium]
MSMPTGKRRILILTDQPIGTGFSYGIDTVNSTEAAAPYVWEAFQILFESSAFDAYQSREYVSRTRLFRSSRELTTNLLSRFIFATESYGGHYGPSFVTYFNQQNALIQSGALQGEQIVVSALMINNGWYDPLIQNQAYVDFATDAPGYGPLQSPSVLKQLNESYYKTGGCKDQEEACYAAGSSTASNKICDQADNYCIDNVFVPAVGNLDSDDLRQNSSALFPPEYYVNYLSLPSVVSAIGAETTYEECPDPPYELFTKTGDDARTWLPQLGELANSSLKILIWAGDADINCNWLGGHACVLAMDWYGHDELNAAVFTNMTIDGSPVAAIKNVDNFSFA